MFSCSLYFSQLHPYSLSSSVFSSLENIDEERIIADAEASLELTESLITTSIFDQVLPTPRDNRNSRSTPQQAPSNNTQPSRVSLNSSSAARHQHHRDHTHFDLPSNPSDSPGTPQDDLSSNSSGFAPPTLPPLNISSSHLRLLRGSNTFNVGLQLASATSQQNGASSASWGGHLFDEITNSTNEDGDDEGVSMEAEELSFEETNWYHA